MKTTITYSLLTCLYILMIGCNSNQQNETAQEQTEVADELPDQVKIEQTLYDEIMVVHDEMMPKMEDMMRLKGKLIEKNDALKEAGLETDQTVYSDAIELIEEADESMMNWMRNFEPMNDGQPHNEIVKYYTEQKEKMDSVKIVMQTALATGEEVLSEN